MKTLDIRSVELQLEAGPYAWPGGYPIYFIAADGEALSFDAVKHNIELIRRAYIDGLDTSWMITAININWEDETLICAHTNKLIPSAYGGNSD